MFSGHDFMTELIDPVGILNIACYICLSQQWCLEIQLAAGARLMLQPSFYADVQQSRLFPISHSSTPPFMKDAIVNQFPEARPPMAPPLRTWYPGQRHEQFH